MKGKSILYFIGCENNKDYRDSNNHILLFTIERPVSLYEALIEFQDSTLTDKTNFKVVKIVEGPANLPFK